MSKKNKNKKIEEYGRSIVSDCCEPCREPKKVIKKRLKAAKRDLKDLARVLVKADIGYAEMNQAVGSAYLNVQRLKQQLESY